MRRTANFAAESFYTEGVMRMTDSAKEKTREYFGFGIKRMREIKVCAFCGTVVDAQKRYCTGCKQELPPGTLYDLYKSHHRVCARCGIVLPENAAYCPECGEKQRKRVMKGVLEKI